MKQQIENIIKKKHNELFKIDFNLDYNTKLNLQRAILDSLADEVLKVVVEKIEKMMIVDDGLYMNCEYNSALDDVLELLTNSSTLEGEQSEHLSPNKENKNNG